MEDQKIYKNIQFDSPKITGKVTGEHQTTQEDWRIPTFTNSWVNYESTETTYTHCRYMKDSLGFVHLKGLVKSGTIGTVVFTLPKGYRPLKQWIFTVSSNDLYGQVRVASTGTVIPQVGSTNWVSLDGIIFLAEQ